MQSTPVPVTEATALASTNSTSSSIPPKFGQSPTTPAGSRPGDMSAQCQVRTLMTGEDLFREGDPRTHVYRVETGMICIYEPRWNGHRAAIRFAVPGDLVGLGFLQHHACTARAMVEARVTCLPHTSMESLVAGNPKAEAELKQALEREFELRKNSLVEFGRRNPVERVAAFLVALSQINKREGRDANVIDVSWQCGIVADQLELSLDVLARILVEFEKRGLVETCPPRGLRLKDLVTLEGLAGEPGTSLLLRDICNCRKRCSCTLTQGQTLLGKSGEAPNIYVVESGVLLVEGPASPSSAHQPRILSIGDVFSLDEGGSHIARCEALTDAVVICVDGISAECLAERDEAAARVPFVLASDWERGHPAYSG
ncbi:MAG: cyclic nucleotide-binding domain-containing protein [Hyphomicrobium sp.]|nr:cyclic nucleotide-binding domain-containing protein [Hyphomicrobium sp.]